MVWGPGRVGFHLAPRADVYSMGNSDRAAAFGYVAREHGKRGIAFICSREAVGPDSLGPQLKAQFGGAFIANEGFTRETAEQALALGTADAVAFGKLFIANPDLPARFTRRAPLNEPIPASFYAPGPVGHIDYPALELAAA